MKNVKVRKKLLSVLFCVLVLCAIIAVISFQTHSVIKEFSAAPTTYWATAEKFDTFANGHTYAYALQTGEQNVKVNSTAEYGTLTNPYVINTPQQWALFADVISNARENYAEADKVFVLNSDLDLNNAFTAPINNFSGRFHGQKHILKNAYIKQNSTDSTLKNYVGLFGKVTNGYISDICMESSCQVIDDSSINRMAGISAVSSTSTFINCTVNFSLSLIREGMTTFYCNVGGISSSSKDCIFAKCTMRGDITVKAQASGPYTDNANLIGGITATAEGSSCAISDCFVDKILITTYNGGPNLAGLIGRVLTAENVKLTVYNCYINASASINGGNTPDRGCVIGWAGKSPAIYHAESIFSKIYMAGGLGGWFASEVSGAASIVATGQVTELYSSASKIETNGNISDLIEPVGSDEKLYAQAKNDLNATGNWNFSEDGNVNIVGEPASEFSINYNLNGGTQGSGAVTTYVNTKNTPLPKPTKTGFTFGGWGRGSVNGAKITTVDAGTSGDLDLYAVWTINDFTECSVSADKTSITYGPTVTLTAKGSHAAAGATYKYQWHKGTTAVSGATSATLSLTTVAQSGTYKCAITVTADGQTKTKDSNAVNITISKADPVLTAPTVTGTAYVGQKLSVLTLSGGSAKNPNNNANVEGTFTWTSSATKIDATSKTYSVTFTPKDTTNYNTKTMNVTVSATQLTVKFQETFKGETKDIKTVNVDYDATLATSAFPAVPSHAGFTGKYDVTADLTNITASKTVTATYTANTNTKYVVQHFKQGLDGKYPTTPTETEDKTGTTDTTATATAKTYTGFTYKADASGAAAMGNIAGDGSLVLKMYYARNSYTLTYELNGGTGTGSANVFYDAEVTKPTDPVKSGYSFGGWFSNEALTTEWKFNGTSGVDKMPANNVTLYAKWTLKDVAANNVTADNATITYGQGRITLTAAATHEGTANGVTLSYKWYKDGAVIAGETSSTLVLDGNVADSGAYTCEVTATGEGQTKSKTSDALTVTVGKAKPAISGLTAAGVNIGQTLADSKLTGGSATNPHNNAVVEGAFAWTTPTAEVEASGAYGVTFTPADKDNYETVTVDVPLTATQLTVSFVKTAPDGSASTRTVLVKHGDTLKFTDFPAITEHVGYTGAYSVKADIENITDFVTVNISYAPNDDTAYTVLHIRQSADGSYPTEGALVEREELTGTTGAQATAREKTYDGFAFDRSVPGSVLTGNIAADGSLVLKVYYARRSYVLYMNLKGGSGVNSANVLYGCAAERPADPTRNGYKFMGWYKDDAYVNLWRFDGEDNADKVTANTKIYAKWEAQEYTIAYTHNRIVDGKNEVDENNFKITPADNPAVYTVISPSFVLDAPTAEGHTFLGWYVEGSDIKISQIVIGSYGDLALEARWAPATYVVRFDAQGGKASVGSMIVTNLGAFGALPTATKDGAIFVGWYMGENGTGLQLNAGDSVILKNDLTVYAYWREIEYAIDFDELTDGTLTVTKDGAAFDWHIGKVKTGDVLKFTVEPKAGYSLVRLMVNGRSTSNGGNFLVKSGYANDKITVTTQTRVTVYTITYYLNGGVQGKPDAGASWATSYTVDTPDIELPPLAELDQNGQIIPNPKNPTKVGYFFNGWCLDKDLHEPAGDFIEQGTTGNISLYAVWEPLEQTVYFRGNYGGAADDDFQYGSTDETITLKPCVFEGRAERADFKFLGWSTTPNGAVEYKDGAEYKVKPYDNVLYAIWHVANMQFVDITVKNDQMIYGTNEEGIVLTPTPGYNYISPDVTLTYQWYRLDTNGVYVRYGEPITFKASDPANADGTNKASISVHTVAECGTFKCVLTATGTTTVDATDSQGNPINMVTTAEGEGTRAITMEKAVFDEISFVGQTVEYDGAPHSITIGNTNLPEGINVSYTGNGVIKAGKFDVIAVFTVPDTSNYKPIDSMKATLTITPKLITSVKFKGDKSAPDKFDYVYNGNPFTVTAELENVLPGDDVRATLSDNSYTAAGAYTALVTGIEGADSGNYELAPSLIDVAKNFVINKASYDVSGVKFAGKTVTYNGAEQSLRVTGGLPAGVTVEYSMTYTPFSTIKGSSGAGNGGVNAGTYVITASFKGDADNYNAIASKQATLVIGKANFTLDYGEFRNTTVSYAVGTYHNPKIDLAGQTLADRLEATYAYYLGVGGQFLPHEAGADGLTAAGVYRIVAQLSFLLGEDVNNYNEIPEKTILFNITDLEVARLVVENYSTKKYVVGDSFDPGEISVTVWYLDGSYEVLDSTRFNIDPATFDKAGKCTVTVTYMDATGTFDVNVEKGDYDLSDVTAEAKTQVSYDKNAHLPELVGELPAGVTAVYTYSFDGKTYHALPAGGLIDAGSYFIKINFTHDDADNFNAIAYELKCTLEIERAEIDIVFGNGSFVYDGNEHELTAKGLFGGEEITLTLTDNKAKDAGEYTATVTLDESYGNYKLPTIGTTKVWTIAAQTVSVEFAEPADPYVYNGGEHTVTVTVKDAQGNVIDAKAVVSFGKDVKFSNAGDYTATVVGLLNADGSVCVNYVLPGADDETLSRDYTILPTSVAAVWEVNIATDGEKWVTYDKAAQQLVYTGALQNSKLRAGFWYGADGNGAPIYHSLTLGFNEAFLNAGSYAVTAANADANFTVTDGAMTIAIAPKSTQVLFEVKTDDGEWHDITEITLVYKGRVHEVRAYYINNAGDRVELDMSVKQNGTVVELLNSGKYTLTGAFIFADENYTLTDETAELTVERKEITVDWVDPSDLVYDGTDKTVTATIPDKIVNDDVALTLKDNVRKSADTYTATATLSGTAADNYKFAAGASEHKFTIAPRKITVTIDDVMVKYSGSEPTAEELAKIGYNITDGSVVVGDTLTFVFTKWAGVNVIAGGYAVTGNCANVNYAVTFAGNYAADPTKGLYLIEKADPTVEPYYDATLYEGKKPSASSLKLKAGGTAGTIAFDDLNSGAALAPGVHAFAWTFTPTDTTNYNVAKGTIDIEIVAVKLDKIEVTTPPNKVSYLEGKIFDPTGIVVTATFNNGSTEQVQDDVTYTIGGEDALTHVLTLGDNKISVSYERDGVTKTCELSISVTDKEVIKLEIEKLPTKTDYVAGQKFSADGLSLRATYQDGSSETITGNWAIDLDGVALLTTHTKAVVTYGGMSVEIGITVVRRAVEKIEITAPPTQTAYTEGTAFDAAGIKVKATYNDGTSEEVGSDKLSWNNGPLSLGDTSVRINYDFGGKTAYADQSIEVVAKKIVSIAIASFPTKTVYDAFTRFDPTGMVVKATYDNGTTEEITEYEVLFDGVLTVDVTSVTIKAGDATAEVVVTVEPVDMDMNGVTFESKTFAFDGSGHGIAVTGLPEGVTVRYKVNGGEPADTVNVTEIGAYAVEAVFTTEDPNYKPIGSMTATLTISKLMIYDTDGLGIDVDAEITYNGETRTPHLVGKIKDADGNAVDLAAAGITCELRITQNGDAADICHSGSYLVTAVFGHNNAGYAAIDAMTFTVTVGKAELTLTANDAEIFAGHDVPEFAYTLTGFVGEDTVDNVPIEGSVVCVSDYEIGDPAGVYAIEAQGELTAADYTFKFVAGTLTVKAVVVERIEITVQPDKTKYLAGEAFDPAGMEVRAYYNDGTDASVTDYTYPESALTPGTTAVEIAYEGKTATVTVTVELPVMDEEIVFGDATVTYDGQTHVLEATDLPSGVTVTYLIDGLTDNTAREAGTYVVTARFTVTDGSAVIADKTATLTIAPREITGEWLETNSLIEDGTEKTPQIVLNGVIDGDDAGLAVTYDRTPIAAGNYTARLTIANGNYVLAATEVAFEIRHGNVTGTLEGSEQPGVIVTGDSGFKPDTEVAITPVTDEKALGDAAASVDGRLNYLYDISLTSGGQEYRPDGKVQVKVLITDKTLFYKDLHVYRYEADGNVTDMNAVRDGDYMVFETEHFSRYAIVTVGEGAGLHPAVIGAIIGSGVLLAAAAVVIIVMQMRKKKRRVGGSGKTGKPGNNDKPRT